MAKRNMSRDVKTLSSGVQMRPRKTIYNDVEIEIMNNMDCGYTIYSEEMTPKTKTLKKGGVTRLTWKELNALNSEKPGHFTKMRLIITDVYNVLDHTGNETDVEIDDVLNNLDLLPLYTEYRKMITQNLSANLYDAFGKGEYPSYTDIRTLILESDFESFEKVMKDIPKQFRARIVEIAAILYRSGEFKDMNKAQCIEKYMGEEFFEDINVAKEYIEEKGLDID